MDYWFVWHLLLLAAILGQIWTRKVSCIGWPYIFWDGNNPSFLHDVLWYCNKAWHSVSSSRHLPLHVACMIFFMDFTAVSALPLHCGVEVQCTCAKEWNCLAVNCGPLLIHRTLRTAMWQNISLNAVFKCFVVVSLPNQLSKEIHFCVQLEGDTRGLAVQQSCLAWS